MSGGGNLRPAPFYLRASVVRAAIGDLAAIRKAVVEVPVLPVKLVDRPRSSEDPRLARANDDTDQISHSHGEGVATVLFGESGPVTGPESAPALRQAQGNRVATPEPEPEGWPDAPLPEQADPDLDRPLEDQPTSCSRLPVKESGLAGMAARESVSQIQLVKPERVAKRAGEKRSPTLILANETAKPEPLQVRHRKSRATGVRAAELAAKGERDRQLLELYAEGTDVAELAERFGLAVCTVREIARDAGLKRTTGKMPSAAIAARNAEIAQAYAAGESILTLMERHDLSRANIYKIAEKAGVERKRELKPRPPRVPRASAAKPEKQAVRVTCHKGETPPSAVIEAAVAKLAEIAASAPQPRPRQARLPMHPMPHVAANPVPAPVVQAPIKPVTEGFDLVRARRIAEAGKAAAAQAREARSTDRRARRAAEEDDAVAAFAAALDKVRARKAGVVLAAPAKAAEIDWKRVADAHAGKAASPKKNTRPAPTIEAPSREECPRCGIPGWRGCDHFLPCADQRVIPASADDYQASKPGKPGQFNGLRRGLSVMKI